MVNYDFYFLLLILCVYLQIIVLFGISSIPFMLRILLLLCCASFSFCDASESLLPSNQGKKMHLDSLGQSAIKSLVIYIILLHFLSTI